MRLVEHFSYRGVFCRCINLKQLNLVLDIDREYRLRGKSIFRCMAFLRDACVVTPNYPAAKKIVMDVRGWYFTAFKGDSKKGMWVDLDLLPSGGRRFDVIEKEWSFRMEGQDPCCGE